ncbi:glycoside hydrolase family 78 protein [Microbacterium sp. P26]|uniref:glycoside hydrolase family 78 protein n=1 Tax=Microbacterium TaxID=33882 RepID=UPI00203C2DD5|nr:glycoside hydrolase family 78 protein [Microbacterium sp. P26]MCM3501216.1 glycoside hydrolase family 78 protein [Microbacterium sp. P26]
MIHVSPVTFEHLPHALGIGVATPRLSWKTSAPAGWRQSAYELELSVHGRVETTALIADADSVLLAWPFSPLRSRERVSVSVRVHGEDGSVSEWSPSAPVEAGLLEEHDWVASVVGPDWAEDAEALRRPPRVRRRFDLDGTIVSARLYATAHGLYEVEINGRRVGDDALSPGWTVYGERLRYYTYDVTGHLVSGANTVGAWLADGWYRGRLGFHGGYPNLYGSDIGLIAQLEVEYVDGRREVIATDDSWEVAPSPILTTGLYEGERYDARLHRADWAGASDPSWRPARALPVDHATLVAPEGAPVRCTEELAPVSVERAASGAWILDFGQNISGRLLLQVRAEAGREITIRHAEVLQDGELYTRPLRGAAATDVLVTDGGPLAWEPRFTIHGFRYAEISGWPGEIEAGAVVARVYHTDMERTGWFESSDALLNRLHENVRWSMRDNFVDIPTDCPQRDERLGWTGDLQVFAPAASYLYDCSGMLRSWLRDVAVEQLPDGTVPWYVPVIPGGDEWTPIRPGAAWGDVAVLTPWTLYRQFGDVHILRDQYDSARRWVDLVTRLAGPDRLWNSGFQLGDWLDPAAPPHDPADATTDRYLVATAYFAWSSSHLAKMAEVLGNDEDARRYRRLAEEVKDAFRREYVAASGLLTSDAQTAYALAIEFDLADGAEEIARWGQRLADLVRQGGNRIATGFAGTPLITDALTHSGHVDVAYDLLFERECPSWFYTVLSGGTTTWERWDSLLPDGTVNPGGMTSFNHFALGAVADWIHRTVGGLAPIDPGYRRIAFRPQPGGGLTFARAAHETPYGRAAIDWHLDEGELSVRVVVPTGATGVVELPGGESIEVGSGVHTYTTSSQIPATV